MTTEQTISIVGIGLVTPLGASAWSTYRALLESRCTSDRVADLPVDSSPTMLARGSGACAGSGFTHSDPAAILAEKAARAAIDDAARTCGFEAKSPVRTIVASSKGAVLGILTREARSLRPQHITLGPHGYLCSELRRRLGLGETTAIVAACATGLYALDQAVRELESGRMQTVLVVAVEAALHELFVESYHRLGVLAPVSPPTGHVARPLDQARSGFTLNECAAAIVLTSHRSESKPHAHVLRTRVGTEPHDLVRSPTRFQTLERIALSLADGGRMSLIQPHATGTAQNDENELQALSRGFGDKSEGCPVYASKGALGHGMGASGLVNVVLSCLIGKGERVPPMPWLSDPISSHFTLHPEGAEVLPGRHAIFAAGFGGHTAGVLLDVP